MALKTFSCKHRSYTQNKKYTHPLQYEIFLTATARVGGERKQTNTEKAQNWGAKEKILRVQATKFSWQHCPPAGRLRQQKQPGATTAVHREEKSGMRLFLSPAGASDGRRGPGSWGDGRRLRAAVPAAATAPVPGHGLTRVPQEEGQAAERGAAWAGAAGCGSRRAVPGRAGPYLLPAPRRARL